MRRRDVLVLGSGLALAGTMPGLARAGGIELLKAGQISAATEGTYPPFSFKNASGELDGIEIRTMREVCKRIGVTHVAVETKWDSMLVGLLADQWDLCSDTMAITEERKKKVWFCDGWMMGGARLVVQNSSAIKTNADAKGKTVGTLVASIYIPLVDKLGATLKAYQSDVEALQDLANGKIDAMITDGTAAAFSIKTGNLPLRMTDEVMAPSQNGWPVKKGKKELVMTINKAMDDIRSEGLFKAICMEFIGIDLTPKDPVRSDFS